MASRAARLRDYEMVIPRFDAAVAEIERLDAIIHEYHDARRAAEAQVEALKDAVRDALPRLRHAYQQGVEGSIKNQHAYVRGLLGPQVERLEKALTEAEKRR